MVEDDHRCIGGSSQAVRPADASLVRLVGRGTTHDREQRHEIKLAWVTDHHTAGQQLTTTVRITRLE
ncbi:MAG: hypothetical protein M3325_05955, partial [Actinomycetota bacterium]|nr:hypothetical protein [Actinomycetota bacterium]